MRNRFSSPLQVGTVIERALSSIGITSEKVEKFLGRPCGCKRRRDKLNQLSNWAFRVIRGSEPAPRESLDKMIEGE